MPTVIATLEALDLLGWDLAACFTKFHPETATLVPGKPSGAAISCWLSAHRGNSSIEQLAKACGLSRYQVSRILSGASIPRLPLFLNILETLTGRATDWVTAFVPAGKLPSVAEEHRCIQESRRIVYAEPWASAILTLLEIQGTFDNKQSSEEFIRHCLPAPDNLSDILEQLVGAGVLLREVTGSKCIQYRILRPVTIDLRGVRGRKSREFWSEAASARAKAPGEQDLLSYNLFSVSKNDMQKVKQLQLQFFRQLRSLVSRSSPSEVAGCIVWHTIIWDEQDSDDIEDSQGPASRETPN